MADAKWIRHGGTNQLHAGSPAVTNFLHDATTDQSEFIFRAPEPITITKLGYRYGLRALTPPTFKISLQGVDASGNPDGTIKGGASPASATFTPPADTTWDNTWRWQTLDNSYTCTRGEALAVVIAYSSGTVSATNNSSFGNTQSATGVSLWGLPYAIQNNAGTRTKQVLMPLFGYASASKVYGYPLSALYAPATGLNTTPDEIALAFNLDSGYGSTFQVAGVRLLWTQAAATSLRLQLYTGTTVLQSLASFDCDQTGGAGLTRYVEVYFGDSTLSTLNFGSTYRVGLRPNEATTQTFRGITCAAAADLEAYAGGQQFYLSTRTDDGAWTDDTASRPFIDLILADVTKPSGGGLLVHPGMAGGARG